MIVCYIVTSEVKMISQYERRLNQIKSFIEVAMQKENKTKEEILKDLTEKIE
jgi:hypothetical protein